MEYKENSEFRVCEWRSDVYTETGADYSLPDYNGDVRKILYTEAKVRPSGGFENGGNVDFSGIIVYNMVYSDSENKINTVSFTSDYDFSIKCDSERYVSSFADTAVASYAMRLLGPRKISAKATLSSKVVLENRESFPIEGSAFQSGIAPEIQSASVSVAKATVTESLEREYAEELLRLDGRVADEVQVVYSDAECVIDSATAEEGGVALKGVLRIVALINCEGEPMQMAEKTIRIDESVPADNVSGAMRILPRATVSSVRCSVTADEGGCSLVANVIADLSAESYSNENVSLVTDAYRCDSDTENEYGEYRFYELSTALTEKEELAFTVERESLEIENLRDIICLGAEIKVTDTGLADGVCNISGDVNYSGIASGLDEKGTLLYLPFKHTANFNKNVNINCQNDEKIKLIPTFSSSDAAAVVDEGNVYLSCKSQMKLVLLSEGSEKILTRSELLPGGEYEDTGAKITVYYPEAGESLFEIAKKFHTTVEKISADNSVSRASAGDGDLGGNVRKLVIF